MSRIRPSLLFPVAGILALLVLGWIAKEWVFSAKLFPMILVVAGVLLFSVQLALELWGPSSASRREAAETMDVGMGHPDDSDVTRRGLEIWAWLLGFLLMILVVGMAISLPLFSFLYLKIHARERWSVSLIIPLFLAGFMYALFERVLHVPWIEGLLWTLF